MDESVDHPSKRQSEMDWIQGHHGPKLSKPMSLSVAPQMLPAPHPTSENDAATQQYLHPWPSVSLPPMQRVQLDAARQQAMLHNQSLPESIPASFHFTGVPTPGPQVPTTKSCGTTQPQANTQ